MDVMQAEHQVTPTSVAKSAAEMSLATSSAYVSKDMLRIALLNYATSRAWDLEELAMQLWIEGSEVMFKDLTSYLIGQGNFEALDSIQVSQFAALLGWSIVEVRIAGGQFRLVDIVSQKELRQIRLQQEQCCVELGSCSDDLALFNWVLGCQSDQGSRDAALFLLPSYERLARTAWPDLSEAELKELRVLV